MIKNKGKEEKVIIRALNTDLTYMLSLVSVTSKEWRVDEHVNYKNKTIKCGSCDDMVALFCTTVIDKNLLIKR